MRKTYQLLLALVALVTTLASCSRSSYVFNNKVPAYLNTEKSVAVARPAAPAQPATNANAAAPAATQLAPKVAVTPAAPKAASVPATASAPVAPETAAAVASVAKPEKLSLVQRLALKKNR